MDAIQFLKQEHERAKAGFVRIERALRSERQALWQKLRPELETHEHIEEAALYGPLAHDAQHRDHSLSEWNREHSQEVHEAERLMRDIDGGDAETDQWLSRVRELQMALERHIEREEHEIFPRLGLVWNRERLDRAGGDLERMKHDRSRRAA